MFSQWWLISPKETELKVELRFAVIGTGAAFNRVGVLHAVELRRALVMRMRTLIPLIRYDSSTRNLTGHMHTRCMYAFDRTALKLIYIGRISALYCMVGSNWLGGSVKLRTCCRQLLAIGGRVWHTSSHWRCRIYTVLEKMQRRFLTVVLCTVWLST